MSVKLANGEKLIRNYEYGTVDVKGIGKSSGAHRTLIVTNRRIIHQETSVGKGSERISTSEMPIKSAKYVNTFYGMKSYPILIVLGVIFALVALITLFASEGGAAKIIGLIVFGAIAALCFIVYARKKDYTLTCSIDSESYVTHVLNFSTKSGNSLTRGLFSFLRKADRSNVINVKVSVNKDVAKQLAEELGSIVTAAANGDYDVEETVEE